ncbi:bifunctional oligoribonuclease/PAP phosphatase NrnA [Candidatus Peregrinibacteria bacterium]|nr:bifunctional oligoribonuclease/PAP phosphatase NrnA [Candidatus Peregrinibacteria bacterium]
MEEFTKAKKLINNAANILILAHRRPDGDTLGVSCALYLVFQKMDKSCTMACIDAPTDRFDFLPEINKFVKDFNPSVYDLIILADAADTKIVMYDNIYPELFNANIPIIVFDHHHSNEGVAGAVNIIDTRAASASAIVYKFFRFINVHISPQIATCLLTGIYNDTGSFMHSNTSKETLEIASDLMRCGAKVPVIIKSMFKNTPISSLKLWGRALENLKITEDGAAISVLMKKDFEECEAESNEAGGIIEKMSGIPEIKFAVLLHETGTSVKGSMRTIREDVDLAKIAGLFGGGGHRKAAGFVVPGRIEKEIRWKIIPEGDISLKGSTPISGLFVESASDKS